MALVGVAIGGWLLLTRGLGGDPPAWLIGFVVGLAVASVPWTIWMAVTSVDGSASWRAGAEAEEWTGSALKRLGSSWIVEHNLPFAYEWGEGEIDVDHVAVGPYGVLVVETKYSTSPVDLSAPRLSKHVLRAAGQARANAGRVRASLQSSHRDVPLVPMVVFWGPAVKPSPDGFVRNLDGVRLVRGNDAKKHWVPLLQQVDRLAPERRDEIVARLHHVADRQRAKDSRARRR